MEHFHGHPAVSRGSGRASPFPVTPQPRRSPALCCYRVGLVGIDQISVPCPLSARRSPVRRAPEHEAPEGGGQPAWLEL